MNKTNVMRLLDKDKIKYTVHDYTDKGFTNGVEIANYLKEDPQIVFKTLVCESPKKEYFVFMIPVAKELDLKKCAKSVNQKSIEMIKQKELLPLTGYIHGGCSPLGMKKMFTTVIDISLNQYDDQRIFFSGGKVGLQIEMNKNELSKVLKYTLFDLTKNQN